MVNESADISITISQLAAITIPPYSLWFCFNRNDDLLLQHLQDNPAGLTRIQTLQDRARHIIRRFLKHNTTSQPRCWSERSRPAAATSDLSSNPFCLSACFVCPQSEPTASNQPKRNETQKRTEREDKRMASSGSHQLSLLFGLLYACGALLEFLARVLFHGIPQHLPEPFYRRKDLIILRPFIFFVLPALVWPFIMIYRVGKPLVDLFRECFLHKEDGNESNWGGSSCSSCSSENGSSSRISNFVDLEKQEAAAAQPQPFTHHFSESAVTLSLELDDQFSIPPHRKSSDEIHMD